MNPTILITALLVASVALLITYLFWRWKKRQPAQAKTDTQEANAIVQALLRHEQLDIKDEQLNALTEAVLALMTAREKKYIPDQDIEYALQQLKLG
ncbi:MAG: hypothetical protein SVR94_14170, partial [Pseudomonadota bacterium]|nr:hypothetical protein [Pseudomonadota bacterium]